MAKIKQSKAHGTLLIQCVPSIDHSEEIAVSLEAGIPVRIHGRNGGYLFTLHCRPEDGLVRKYHDERFSGRPRVEELIAEHDYKGGHR